MYMHKRVLAKALIALCGSTALVLPGFAQTNPATPAASSQPAAASQSSLASRKHPQTKAVPAPGSRLCLRDTGSHIRPPKGQCLPVAGDSYSQRDIKRTGAVTMGQALQMLDPSVTVHGH